MTATVHTQNVSASPLALSQTDQIPFLFSAIPYQLIDDEEIDEAAIQAKVSEIESAMHGISTKLIKSTLITSKKFFALPKHKKIKIAPQKWNKKSSNIKRYYYSKFIF